MSVKPILIVDGLNFFMRHYVANPSMSDQGHHIGGIVGFLKGLWHLCDRVSPEGVVVAWEGGGSPRRRAVLKNYKDKRRPPKFNRFYADDIPDSAGNRNDQISQIIEILKTVPVAQIYVADCEADDIVAYLVKYTFADHRCVVVVDIKQTKLVVVPRCVRASNTRISEFN